MIDIVQTVALAAVTASVGAVFTYIRGVNEKINRMITETKVRTLIQDKMAIIDVTTEATKARLERVEESLVRLEDKMDKVLSFLIHPHDKH